MDEEVISYSCIPTVSPCPDPWNSLQHIIILYLINLSNTAEIEEQLFQGSGVATALGCIF